MLYIYILCVCVYSEIYFKKLAYIVLGLSKSKIYRAGQLQTLWQPCGRISSLWNLSFVPIGLQLIG